MPSYDYKPRFDPGNAITVTAGAGGLQEGRLATAGGTIAGATSNTVLGVAAQTVPQGAQVTVFRGSLIVPLVASAALTAGVTVKAGAGGTVVPWVSGTDAADTIVGRALAAAATNATVDVALKG